MCPIDIAVSLQLRPSYIRGLQISFSNLALSARLQDVRENRQVESLEQPFRLTVRFRVKIQGIYKQNPELGLLLHCAVYSLKIEQTAGTHAV